MEWNLVVRDPKMEWNFNPNTFRTLPTNINAKWIFGQNIDKGSGLIMLDYNEYMKAWYAHLTISQSQNNKYSIILSFIIL